MRRHASKRPTRWSTRCQCTCTEGEGHNFIVNDAEGIRTMNRAYDIRPSNARIAAATASYKPKTMQTVLRDAPGNLSSGSNCRCMPLILSKATPEMSYTDMHSHGTTEVPRSQHRALHEAGHPTHGTMLRHHLTQRTSGPHHFGTADCRMPNFKPRYPRAPLGYASAVAPGIT